MNSSAILCVVLRPLSELDDGVIRAQAIEQIRAEVGDRRVICGLGGGVDSAVAAALVHEAVGDQLHCIMIDHGLLRANKPKTLKTCSAATLISH